jgi:Holliday junction resolvasome RuvABC endonuclease subunit
MLAWVIGVDPGKGCSGWTLVEYEPMAVSRLSVVAFSSVSRGNGLKDYRELGKVVGIVRQRAEDKFSLAAISLALEDQYVGVNKRSALTLAVARGKWEGMAELMGIGVELVQSAEWRSKELGSAKLTRPQAKRQALLVANQHLHMGLGENQHDVAESALIASWAARQIQMRHRMEAGKATHHGKRD